MIKKRNDVPCFIAMRRSYYFVLNKIVISLRVTSIVLLFHDVAGRNLWICVIHVGPYRAARSVDPKFAQGSMDFAYERNNFTVVVPRWRRHNVWTEW